MRKKLLARHCSASANAAPATLGSIPDARRFLGLGQPEHGLEDRFGSSQEVALRFGRAKFLHQVELVLGLDAFRRRADAQAVGELDDGPDDGPAIVTVDRFADEDLVDLDLVEGKAAQIVERGEAHAEIVEIDPDADRLKTPELREGRLVAAQQRGFGDLELEPASGEPRALQRRADDLSRRPVLSCTGDRLTAMLMSGGICAASRQA